MNYWLVKFAPFRVSWQDILRQGRFEIYGVRNFQAKNNVARMKLGDLLLFYHSQEEKQIMGILQVSEEAHQDKTTGENWLSVTFEPIKTLEKPIELSQIKCEAALQNIGLVKQQRLAVMGLEEEQFERILKLGEK